MKNYGYIENGAYIPEECPINSSLIYKNWDAFKSKEGVCYIPAHVYEDIDLEIEDFTKENIEQAGGHVYTYEDILKECLGNEESAEYIFNALTYEHVETAVDQAMSYGAICPDCGKYLEEDEECSCSSNS